ncbi:zinc finger BED domain-containing protein 1-like [Hippocampus comes]|uniref:Zinc finger BED domain-containing protein 1-like n=1 Tax=Hippocampus comes TaxID=109280 RepID=A0A3Q3DV36_HIPCM|nr:PREDICTED: zinc finger BED domain-containing protein 1-like [Hippocampus comes]
MCAKSVKEEEYEEEVCGIKEEKEPQLLDAQAALRAAELHEVCLIATEQDRKRARSSDMWEHFSLITPDKVQCLACSAELKYHGNTSSMVRHFAAKHGPALKQSNAMGRKQALDEALVNLVVKDWQPFSIVDDCGFKALVASLDPTYALPSRRALKKMVAEKSEEEKSKAKAAVGGAEAVSLTAETWSSIQTDARVAVTCHFLDDSMKVATALLGVLPLPEAHTSSHISERLTSLVEEWGIEGKVTSVVTDAAPEMAASVRDLNLRHVLCFARSLHLVVKKSLDATAGLRELRGRARNLVALFKSSAAAQEKLRQAQAQMCRPAAPLVQEAEARWTSTFLMLQRLCQERRCLDAALAALGTDAAAPLSPQDDETAAACLRLLAPFYQAAVEMSQEKRLAGSKVIPITKMLLLHLYETNGKTTHPTAKRLGHNLVSAMQETFDTLESQTALTLSTLLDPRFKTFGFYNQAQAQTSVKRLAAQCSQLIVYTPPGTPAEERASAWAQPGRRPLRAHHFCPFFCASGIDLWKSLDRDASEAMRWSRNASVDATAEVQRYMSDPPLGRAEDPLAYWLSHQNVYPHLFRLAKHFLCTPASAVPCERVFSKCGEEVSKKRNRLSPKSVEMIMYLNKSL